MFYNTCQDELPNERKIVKLCEYAAKNPFRIPKVFILLFQSYVGNLLNLIQRRGGKYDMFELAQSISEVYYFRSFC
jgi:hypothetical protein